MDNGNLKLFNHSKKNQLKPRIQGYRCKSKMKKHLKMQQGVIMAPNKNLSEVNVVMDQNPSKKEDFQKPQKSAKKKIAEARKWTNVSLALSLVMLVISILHTIHLFDLTREIRNAETHYVQPFPEFIPAITDLVNETKKEIIIFQDVTSFGLFSDPYNYQEFIHALWKKSNDGKKIRLTAYNPRLTHECRANQFGVSISDTIPDEIKDKEFSVHVKSKLKKTYDKFIMFSFGSEDKHGALKEDFKQLNEIRDRILFGCKDLKQTDSIVSFRVFNMAIDSMTYYIDRILSKNVSIYESSKFHSMHYWFRDGKEVIFALPRHKTNDEVAFRTTNGNFITHIKGLIKMDMDTNNFDIRKKFCSKK